MSKDTAQALLARVDELIGADLQTADDIFDQELTSWHPYITDVLQHITRFRGKRLRPMLLMLTGSACGGIRPEHHTLAAVVEMIHTATLVHDDVLDEADIRRHVATVNARWNNETSVLFGDFLFTHAFHLAATLESAQACRLIGRATNLVCEGELAQIHERGNLNLTEEQYLQIIEGKTAELCAVSCRLGAIYSDASEEVIEAMSQYGRTLGIAFQIADDLLDLCGNERQAGKTLGSDLVKQKLTLPLIRLLDQAEPTDAQRVRELLASPETTDVTALLSVLEQYDAIEFSRQRALEFAGQARVAISCLSDSPAYRVLDDLTEFAVRRSF